MAFHPNSITTLTILRNKRISIGAEANEPVPVPREAEQDGGGMEAKRDRGGPFGVGEIGLPHDVNVLRGFKDGVGLHGDGHELALCMRGGSVEVEEVDIERVVYCVQEAKDPCGIAPGTGDEVGDGGRRRGRGFVGVKDEAVGMSRVEKRVGS